jgi:hypothetical protein
MRRRVFVNALLVAAIGLFAPCVPAVGASGWGLDVLMNSLSQQRSGHAQFVETKYLSTLKTPLTVEGLLHYQYPDYMEKEVRKPGTERYVISRDSLEVWRGGKLAHLVALSDYPVMQGFMASFLATMGGDLSALNQHFDVKFSGPRERWAMQLLPHDKDLRDHVQQIDIRGAGSVIQTFEVRQRNGDRSVMRLTPVS